jgi:hypothetical protein
MLALGFCLQVEILLSGISELFFLNPEFKIQMKFVEHCFLTDNLLTD